MLKITFMVPPPNSGTNHYYYQDTWKGIRVLQAEVAEFNIETLDFGLLGPLSNLLKYLEKVHQNHCDETPGLVASTVGDPVFTYFINQFNKRSVPAVLTASGLPQAKRLCHVRVRDLMAGSLAAELILSFTADKGKVLMVSSDIMASTHYMNVADFEQYFAKARNQVDIIKIYSRRDPEHLHYELVELLRSDLETSAIYSCTVTNTSPVYETTLGAGRTGTVKVIGNDLFQESREMLLSDVLQVIIYKKPLKLGYLDCRTLSNFLVKNEFPRSDSIFIEPTIILKSNLPLYERDITTDSVYETI